MRAGKLKDFITIEKPTIDKNEVGEEINTFEKFCDAYCEVTNIGTSEKYFNARYENVNSKKFRIRFIPGVTTSMRIKLDDEYFDIKEVVDPYRNKRELLIAAQKVD